MVCLSIFLVNHGLASEAALHGWRAQPSRLAQAGAEKLVAPYHSGGGT